MDGKIVLPNEEDKKATSLRVITGGKGPVPPRGIGHDWLSPLPAGTVCVVRKPAVSMSECTMMSIVFTGSDTIRTLLWHDGPDHHPRPIAIEAFCKEWELMDILGEDGQTGADDG